MFESAWVMLKEKTSLPLQSKVSLTLALVFAVFSVLSYAILKAVIAPAFDDLDLSAASTNLVRAERAIETDIENLAAVTADWAPWDDIHDYVRGEKPEFKKSNLERPTLENLGLDVLVVYATESERVWSQLLVEGIEHDLDELRIFAPNDPAFQRLSAHQRVEDHTIGLVQTALGPMLISSMPIVRSDGSGPIAGAVVMGQFLDDVRIARLRERTEVNFSQYPIADVSNNFDLTGVIASEQRIVTKNTTIDSFKMVNDIFGEPLLILKAETPRRISALGGQTLQAAMLFLFITGVIVTFVIWWLLRGAILKPIESLAAHLAKIRESGDLSHKLELGRTDEIGSLASQFDDLTTEVHEARKALLFQSFKAGKADTAAEVLHNIRNAMTPMINGLDRLSRSFKVAEGLRVSEATKQLADPDCPPDRASKYLTYIDASFDHVKSINSEALEEMSIVTSQARQVEAILSDQERFTNAAPIAETILIGELVGEATHVIPKDATSDVDVSLESGLSGYRVRAHRIGLLQVLGNLLLNAYESIERHKTTNGQILLSASDRLVDDKPMVQLTVRDNGGGFDKDAGPRIFQRGFTSKQKGDTTGLGLHWCANAVASMGGRIFAESLGVGEGAEFHVLLPAVQGG